MCRFVLFLEGFQFCGLIALVASSASMHMYHMPEMGLYIRYILCECYSDELFRFRRLVLTQICQTIGDQNFHTVKPHNHKCQFVKHLFAVSTGYIIKVNKPSHLEYYCQQNCFRSEFSWPMLVTKLWRSGGCYSSDCRWMTAKWIWKIYCWIVMYSLKIG